MLSTKFFTVIAAFTAAATLAATLHAADPAPASAGPLKVAQTFSLGGAGRWDYITVDPASHRLYIPRSTRVAIVDSNDGSSIGEIPDTSGVHGVALAPDQQIGFSSNGKENTVSAFDLKSFKLIKKIKTGKNPDAIIYDPASKHILAMDHSGGDITVIDPANLDAAPIMIDVGGKLEYAVSDNAGHVYVNVEDKSEIVQIDSKANKVLAHWSLSPAEGPTGLAIDIPHHRLFAGCDGTSQMAVLDANTGKILANVPIGKGVDGCTFDPIASVAISANGDDGTLSIIKSADSSTDFPVIQTLPTIKSARTITTDPIAHKIFLPCTTADGKTFGVVVVGGS